VTEKGVLLRFSDGKGTFSQNESSGDLGVRTTSDRSLPGPARLFGTINPRSISGNDRRTEFQKLLDLYEWRNSKCHRQTKESHSKKDSTT